MNEILQIVNELFDYEIDFDLTMLKLKKLSIEDQSIAKDEIRKIREIKNEEMIRKNVIKHRSLIESLKNR